MFLSNRLAFATVTPSLIVTFSGAASGLWNFDTDGATLYLTTVGDYAFTFNRSGNILVKGASSGTCGRPGDADCNPAGGGNAGGGGAVISSGASVTVSAASSYTGKVGNATTYEENTGSSTPGANGGNTEFMIASSTVYMRLLGAAIRKGGTVSVGSGTAGGEGGDGAAETESQDPLFYGSVAGADGGAGGGGGGGGSNGNSNSGATAASPGGSGISSGQNTSGTQGGHGVGGASHPSGGADGGGGGGGWNPGNGTYYGGGGGGGGGNEGTGGLGKQGVLVLTYVS